MSISVVLGLLFALFGASLFRSALKNYKKAQKSTEWVQATGKVKKVVLIGKRLVDGKMQDADRLQMDYLYSVEGKEYTGHQIAFYTLSYPASYEFAQSHSVDSEITIYHNPTKPNESVLITGLHKDKPYSELVMAALALLCGFIVMVAGLLGLIG